MSFFSRIVNHFLNEVLVNGLANSRTFQRFAIWSNEFAKDVALKGKDHIGQASKFATVFKEQLKKEMANADTGLKPPVKR